MSFELQSIYMYYDTDDQWKAAYNNGSLTCNDRERLLDPKNYQIIRLAPSAKFIDEHASCEKIEKNNESWYHCFGKRSFFSMRPRWWYFAIGNCDSQKGLYLEYSLLMTNSINKTNRWKYHFSFDEFYTLPISLLFLFLIIFVLFSSIIFSYVLKKRKMLHITFRLFLHSLFCELIASTLIWMHFDRYADDGEGMPLLKFFSMILRQFSIVLFVLLLFLIAKGYTITRAKISTCSSIKIVLFISAYFILRLLMLGWEIIIFDPAQVTHMSESVPAYCIVYLNICGWIWFSRCSWVTVKKYPLKKRFYIFMNIFSTFWFWSGPIVLIIANFILDNWVREEVVQGVDSAIITFGFIFFLILTCPFCKAKHFPYHIRTNQIANQQNNFPNNVYEVGPIQNGTTNNCA
ncbi:hypothetical protein ACQ4LE_006027 [Meloidogyne hapla]